MAKKYPIGTRIRFLYKGEDTNKIGTIVGITCDKPDVYLPTGEKHIKRDYYPVLADGTKFTWHCGWYEIEPIGQQQLEFDFMNE